MSMDFMKTLEQFEASKNEIDEEAPTNEVINEGIDTIDIVEGMKMDNVDINTIAHIYPHQVSPCLQIKMGGKEVLCTTTSIY